MHVNGLMRRVGKTMSLATFAAMVAAAPAMATTVGSTTLPTGSNMGPACSASKDAQIIQSGTDASYNYTVPAGGGSITSWSFNTTNAIAGTPYTLLVARPSGSSYQIVATDAETVPVSPPPIATYTLAKPITVQGGDVLGVIVTAGKNTVGCRLKGGPISANEIIGSSLSASTIGSSFSLSNTTPNELVNVSANIVQSNDVAVTQVTEPASITRGDDGVFVLSVTNTGPSSTPVTITDTLPAGLSLVSASAGTGICSASGQTVTCTVSAAPASVAIVASAAATGTYSNNVSVQGTILDPNLTNNAAAGSLTVTAPGTTTPAALTGLTTQGTDVGLVIQAGPITI
jgi:uncharacterized repeat protein (TIGR01451 family)